jgi:hypothetical protein
MNTKLKAALTEMGKNFKKPSEAESLAYEIASEKRRMLKDAGLI